jgi:hypothetical protein
MPSSHGIERCADGQLGTTTLEAKLALPGDVEQARPLQIDVEQLASWAVVRLASPRESSKLDHYKDCHET